MMPNNNRQANMAAGPGGGQAAGFDQTQAQEQLKSHF